VKNQGGSSRWRRTILTELVAGAKRGDSLLERET
jgi:hypothetical protein